jgi:hypothetical protein
MIKEILDKLSEVRSRRDRVEVLINGNSFALRTVLKLNFDDSIVLDLPKGSPPFTPRSSELVHTIDSAIGGLSLCVKENNSSIAKKELRYIKILETISPDDAKILNAAKDGKLKNLFPALTLSLVTQAFPTIID